MPDHERGYTRRDSGIVPTDPEMNRRYAEKAQHDAVSFGPERQRIVIGAVQEVCTSIDVILYYAVCVTTHVHVLCGWRDERTWECVHDRIKRIDAFKLAKSEGLANRRWLTARRRGEPVETPKHFAHLMRVYLPDHRGETFVHRQCCCDP